MCNYQPTFCEDPKIGVTPWLASILSRWWQYPHEAPGQYLDRRVSNTMKGRIAAKTSFSSDVSGRKWSDGPRVVNYTSLEHVPSRTDRTRDKMHMITHADWQERRISSRSAGNGVAISSAEN